MLAKQLMTNLKKAVRSDRAVTAYSSFPQPIKALAPRLSVRGAGGVSLRTGVSPLLQLLASKINFPFHHPGLFNGF